MDGYEGLTNAEKLDACERVLLFLLPSVPVAKETAYFSVLSALVQRNDSHQFWSASAAACVAHFDPRVPAELVTELFPFPENDDNAAN